MQYLHRSSISKLKQIGHHMSQLTRDAVLTQLSLVKDPSLESNIVSQNMVSDILVDEGRVIFSINVPANQAEELEPLRKAAETAVEELEGVTKVTAVLTAERKAGESRPTPQSAHSSPPGGSHRADVPGVGSIIAVASGKGGVGKSTTSVNLALALQRLGKKVGILDADVYGPSMPRMLGATGEPGGSREAIEPLVAHGLKVMSIGFMVEEETPMIWRGPMVISALTQLLRNVNWGELDILVTDMPPGTGDAQLTMAQQVPLAGAVIVSTPQDIALIDARKGLNMFRKVDVPILGLIENMSTFICPECGQRTDIFGHGGARDEAVRLDIPFLGDVPLHIDIRLNSDGGTPVVASDPDGPHAGYYMKIAERVLVQLEKNKAPSGPEIVFE